MPGGNIETVEAVVAAFGGTKAMADWANVGMPAISNWLDRGYIPPGWGFQIVGELARRGFTIDHALFRNKAKSSSTERRVA
jgi:hypothetical protein